MRVLKQIFNEEMEEFNEPLNPEDSPEPTSEEIPTEEEPILEDPIVEEEPVGIDPADSFYPPNENYDYAPDIHLTGNVNDGIIYPAGAAEETIIPEGDLGLKEETMKVLTYEEAIKVAKKNILEAKKAMVEAKKLKVKEAKVKKEKAPIKEELDLNMGDEYDIATPPVDDAMVDGEEIPEEEPKSEGELVQDILADAEELYRKIAGEEDLGEEALEGEEMLGDSTMEVSDEMLEAKKRVKGKIKARLRKRALKEKIKARLKKRALKEKIKAKVLAKRKLKEDLIPKDLVSDGDVVNTMIEEEETPIVESNKKKITESADKVQELYNMLFDIKYNQETSAMKEAFDEALDILGLTSKSRDARDAWKTITEMGMDGYEKEMAEYDAEAANTTLADDFEAAEEGIEFTGPEAADDDVFFDEAKKRSAERKAYLKKILNEEDTPIMSDPEMSDVEELMGLKILKKMGEDPKLVESRSKKFKKDYLTKKSFNFKKLLENGFLG